MAEHPRTTAARDNDDSAIIDAAIEEGPAGDVGRGGGNLARDVGTQNDMKRAVADPDAHHRVTKENDIANNVARPSDRRGDSGNGV